MGWGAAIAGVASAASSALGAGMSGKDARRAVKAQIAWERERAQNAHQWEVEDLKKAGLNPVLSADGGSGAVTGGISAPMPDRSGYSAAGESFINAINTAFQAANTKADIAKKGAETNNITQDTQNKIAQKELIQKQAINEALRSGLISAQKANLEFKNLTEKYNGERAALTYWNDFINKASTSAKNAADIGTKALEAFTPKKYLKEAKSVFGNGYRETSYHYK